MSEGENDYGITIRLMCIPGRHGIDLPLLEAVAIMGTADDEVPALPEGWVHLPALVLDDPMGGPPIAFHDPDSVAHIAVCPEHIALFRASGRQT